MASGRPQVGIGWRREMSGDLLVQQDAVAFVEVTAEGCTTPEALRETRGLREIWPVAVHGVKTSLGSAEGFDRDRARKLAKVARDVRGACVSEHVAFVQARGVEIGHLTGLPFTREAVNVVARNVAGLRRLLPDVPLLLENVAWAFRWPDDAMDEGDFHAEVVAATGCDLLLDVGNLYANALNCGRDPVELLGRYPLERVAMLHVAGGVYEEGFYFDTHAHPVPEGVFDLVARVLSTAGDVPMVLERDARFPVFAELTAELARLAEAANRSGRRPARAEPRKPVDVAAQPEANLAEAQHVMALRLTGTEPPGDASLARARDILQRKRVDDALPLLPSVAAHGDVAFDLAVRCLGGTPRPPSRVAVTDALRIAKAADDHPSLGLAARSDALLLRARFIEKSGGVSPRTMPFLQRERLSSGRTRWVLKGPGANAPVRVLESGQKARLRNDA
jgi:uncharacterized protein (UPF0276 family)